MSSTMAIEDELYEEGTDGLPTSFEVERIVFEDGLKMYLKGHKYPLKGVPSIKTMEAINQVKVLLKRLLRLQTTPRQFGLQSMALLHGLVISPQFMCACAREVYTMLEQATGDIPFSHAIAAILEYDQAYRFRFQDLASETTSLRLIAYPQKELSRLLEINQQRDYNEVSEKIGKIRKFTYLLWFPPLRALFQKIISQSTFNNLQFDENDVYWATIKRDYNYFGKTFEERNETSI